MSDLGLRTLCDDASRIFSNLGRKGEDMSDERWEGILRSKDEQDAWLASMMQGGQDVGKVRS